MEKEGWIEVITGPMFSGKTEELIKRVKRLEYAKKNIVVLKPIVADRYSTSEIVSHNNTRAKSFNITDTREILKHVKDDTDVIVIDEIQFLDNNLPQIANSLANKGIVVIASGLDTDFRGDPFENMANMLAVAENVTKLSAVCVCCGKAATKTQRLVNGKPANYTDPIVLLNAFETYEPRCRNCHEVLK